MAEIVRRIRPGQYGRIKEHESWFSDMSEQGLHFYEIGTHFAKFKKGDRKRMDYRLELAKSKYISSEKIRLFEESGWDYIASDRNFHVFAAPVDRKASEPPIDREEQISIAKKAFNKALFNFIVNLIAIIVITTVFVKSFENGNISVLQLIDGYTLAPLLVLFVSFMQIIPIGKSLFGINHLRNELKAGILDDQQKPWENFYRSSIVYSFIVLVITLTLVLIPIYQIWSMKTSPLTEEDAGLPIVRLASIENQPHLKRKPLYFEGEDLGSNYSSQWNIFASVQYDSTEMGVIQEGEWYDPNHAYQPSISSEVYKLRFHSHVSSLVNELIIKHTYGSEPRSFKERKHTAFDRLLIRDNSFHKDFLFVKGRAVMYINYTGQVEDDVIIEKAAEKMALLADD
ncbi:DUF2812 domain-containing protein [Solibacillus isronensis]|uniref:DUF2812 domain-containing protein n=1 Tax=Solibacillus isronensis TaxID=412383 RepID=UPI00203A6E06|nr:DUF2812 domain-containing protein [Solibacillus isronensis]MCM3721263.1 DUF2812 domain-containing protein [Solibacillus isronensis]